LFFRSCGKNPSIDWLLITDQDIDKGRLPNNVSVKRTTFAAVRRTINQILGFQTALSRPYKLCDLRPAYGEIFAAEVAGYEYWGYCDMDVLFGDIRKFITDDILRKYDKILRHGHLTLYRNSEQVNQYFRLGAPGVDFREVFTSSKPKQFDEFGGINLIMEHHKLPYFENDNYLADIDRNHYDLRTVQPPNYAHQCFYWEGGKVFKAFHDGNAVCRQEYLYIHLQKRPMRQMFPASAEETEAWYVAPREFLLKTTEPRTVSEMDRLNPRNSLFDAQRFVYHTLWHLRARGIRKIVKLAKRAGVIPVT